MLLFVVVRFVFVSMFVYSLCVIGFACVVLVVVSFYVVGYVSLLVCAFIRACCFTVVLMY